MTKHIDPEPIFGVHIEFCDGPKPIEYFNLNLIQAARVLQDWSEDWILTPDKECELSSDMWYWHANARKTEKRMKNTEDYADILDPDYIPEPAFEYMEPEE